MTTEEKAKAYDELKAIISESSTDKYGCIIGVKPSDLFPELQESEDERIRQKLLFLCYAWSNNEQVEIPNKEEVDETIAWLEKQGEQKPKFRVGDTIKCKYDDRQFTIKSVDLDKGTYTYTQEGCGNDIDYADEEFELVEQKPSDKVEPKFKVGDWVMLDRPVLITKVKDMPYNTHQYWTSDGTWFGDATKAKLWTIQDAEDGDVLANNGNIILFKQISDSARPDYKFIQSYCFVLMHSSDFYLKGTYNLDDGFHPATKEQRDLLFQKMKEAGYEWDAEKKELKKIEQNPAWSEEDELILKEIISDYESASKSFCGHQGKLDWLKSLRPNHWKPSEEQIEALERCVEYLEESDNEDAEEIESLHNDLKKLKEK